MNSLDLNWIRSQFPALSQHINNQPVIFLDGPGGTQIPGSVIDAIDDYLLRSNANAHGPFATSARTDALIASARLAMADFLNCDRDEIVFGANMTTLTFAISRAIGRELQPGDEILVTRLDHDANVTPWKALEERGVIVRMVDIHPEDCTLDMADLVQKLSHRTRLVAISYACNAVGTINDVARVVQLARAVGAWTFVDAVHYAPHGPIDVRSLDCDFLACSVYKFFGPHLGVVYGKRELLARLQPYKLRPASDAVPCRWETGTQTHENLAGMVATIDYLTKLGHRLTPTVDNRRDALVSALTAIQQHERTLAEAMMAGLSQIPGVTVYGITDPTRFSQRTPTFGIRFNDQTPYEVAKGLGDRGIFTWHGNFYAINLTERLQVESTGGMLRIGCVHYNTLDEVERLLVAIQEITVRPLAVA